MIERKNHDQEAEELRKKEKILELSRNLVEGYVNQFGIDRAVVLTTLIDFVDTAYQAAEGSSEGVANFKRLSNNRHFSEFISGPYIKDVNQALKHEMSVVSNLAQKKDVFKYSSDALKQLTAEDVKDEEGYE